MKKTTLLSFIFAGAAATLFADAEVMDLPPFVTGGECVTGWTADAKGWWHAKLPAGTKCSQLFVNGQRRMRPVWPRKGWFYMDTTPPMEKGAAQLIRARPGQIDPSWKLAGAEACVIHAWDMTRSPVDAYDPATRILTFSCSDARCGFRPFGPERWYRLENVKEALGEPGDWYLEPSGDLTYVPKAGERPETAEVWAALREHALVIEGKTNVVVRGVTFAYAGWTVGREGQKCPQAGVNLPAAVLVKNSKNVRFENCVFKHTGAWGLEFGPGAVDCAAVGCEFFDLGAGGVKIGCGRAGAGDPANWATGCRVEDCLVVHGGRVEPAGVGLWIGNANHCVLSHNTIRDMYYSGVSVGWTWDRKPSGAHHNLIEFNDISDIGQRRLMDMGGIYTLGLQPGTRIVGNTIRNVSTTRGCGFALYFDQGTAFVTAVSNYVERGEGGNFFIQYNTASNVVENNAFVCGRDIMLRHSLARQFDDITFPTRFARNVIWWDDPNTCYSSAEPLQTNYFDSVDNVYCLAGSPLAPNAPGAYRREMPKPRPCCAAGRRVRTEVTASLPDVPLVFDECPELERLGNSTGAVISNEHVTVTFDAKGCVSSIRERASGRELVGTAVPFVSFRMKDGRTLAPVELRNESNKYLNFIFPDGLGECWMQVEPFEGGWTFETIKATVRDVERCTLGRLVPACNREKGSLSNIVMDDRSAVALRAYTPELDMYDGAADPELANDHRETFVWVDGAFGYCHKRFGLAAGPADKILGMMAKMAGAAGMTQSGCGGPKSMAAEANRGAYLFTTWMDMGGAEDSMRLLDKAGCRMFHLHAWWLHRGSYEVNPYCFPNGMADMKKIVDRLHAEGKRVSTHSLSAVIQFGDAHIAPEWFDDLATDAEYTLARPYRRGDAELWVNEKPAACHAKILTGGTNGNILRLGDDLLQYADFTTEPPYRFTGVRIAREPYGDKATYDSTQAVGAEFASSEGGTARRRTLSRAEYPAGHAMSYLHHRYAEFVAKPGSRLAELMTDRLAEVFNTLELDGIYFDGSEAMNSRYGIDWLRERTMAKLHARNGTIVNSASCRNPFNWWNRSLAGTWDHPTFGPRAFNDRHIRVYRDECRADFLRTDLGWWNTHAGNALSRGYFPEEQEYVMCKTAANDMTISLQGPRPSDGPLPFAADAQVTIFGKWERARYARAFRPDLLARMKEPLREFVLDQDEAGLWKSTELFHDTHRVATPDFAAWGFDSPFGGKGALRVEALYGVDVAAVKTNAIRVLDAGMLPQLARATAPGVTLDVSKSSAACGETIRMAATNGSADERAAWASLTRHFPDERLLTVNPVSSLWVKGDGSGATLNVQVRRSRIYGSSCSENLLKLDFVGWRKVDFLLRERDADASDRFEWPYENRRRLNNPQVTFMIPLQGDRIESVGFFLNGVARGTTATVELGAWDSLPVKRGELAKGAKVELNGAAYEVPFALPGGDYAELKDGFWTHYAEAGQPVERVAASALPVLNKGRNAARYAGTGADGFARAEVTFFGYGACEPAFVDLTAEQKNLMRVEYEMPGMLDPAKGLDGDFAIKVRPGEKAAWGFEILGPAKNPVVAGRRLPVTLETELDRVASYDGKTWEAIRITPGKCGPDNRTVPADRAKLASGVLSEPLPVLSGGTARIGVTADSAHGARVTLFKKYLD